MDNLQFKKVIQECTTKYGFKYYRNNFYCELENVIIVINIQKSNFDNSYYINYGFCMKDLHNGLQHPKCNAKECDITCRFIDTNNKGNYQLDTLDSEKLIMSVEKNIDDFIVPVINEGIYKFFELYPYYICLMTFRLKEYLGIS